MSNHRRSKAALWVSGIYLIVALAAWSLPLLAKPGESLAGIFLVLVAQPWATVLLWIMDRINIDSFILNMVFMLLSILFNTWALYRVTFWFAQSSCKKNP